MSSIVRGKSSIALVDCNSFFVSCEKVFNPQIQNTPVVVLSNNDGCIIARCKEAKKLVPMGAPAFQYREVFERNKITAYSANFFLYSDMSDRVMQTLRQFTSQMQVYSIDEAFLILPSNQNPFLYSQKIRSTILQWTGIPVSIGIGPTKTLAKAANEMAKKEEAGVFFLETPQQEKELLCNLSVKDVWGIGQNIAAFLLRKGIHTAWEFCQMDDYWIKKHLSIVLLRTAWELRGIPCLPIEEEPSSKKSIISSRSFGRPVIKQEELEESISSHIAYAAEKVRRQNSLANFLEVFILSNPHKEEEYYSNKATLLLPEATAFTPLLTHFAKQALKKIFRPGYSYKKAGVMLGGLVSNHFYQPTLFNPQKNQIKRQSMLMKVIDETNFIYGKKLLYFAAEGIKKYWKQRSEKLTPAYTTKWEEILTVQI